MKTIFPDYKTGMLNLMASLMQHYDVKTPYSTHPIVDKLLAGKYDNVFLILIDGMGSKIIEPRLPKDSFLRKNLVTTMTSVYPPTTAAATTIFDSALAPISSGWLGWFEYFKEVDDYRILFLNQSYYSKINQKDNTIDQAIGYEKVKDKIERQGHGYRRIMPGFEPGGAKTIEEFSQQIIDASHLSHDSFIYAYWDQFDTLMHQVGPDDQRVKESLLYIDQIMADMIKQVKENDLVLIIADHGQLNTKTNDLRQHGDLCATLLRRPNIEARTTAFFIKPERKAEFERLFRRYYPKFDLMTSQEFINKGYLGNFRIHPRVKDFLGDYVSLANDDENLMYGTSTLIGQHSGQTELEMMIPLIAIRGQEK